MAPTELRELIAGNFLKRALLFTETRLNETHDTSLAAALTLYEMLLNRKSILSRKLMRVITEYKCLHVEVIFFLLSFVLSFADFSKMVKLQFNFWASNICNCPNLRQHLRG